MSENFNSSLLSLCDNFISNKCQYIENPKFSVTLSFQKVVPNPLTPITLGLPLIFDKDYNINCVLNLPQDQLILITDRIKKEKTNVIIGKSNFDLMFYKTSKQPSTIGVLLVLIISKIEEISITSQNFNMDKNTNINFKETIHNRIKKFVFSYLKENITKPSQMKFPYWMLLPSHFIERKINFSNYSVENVLIGRESIDGKIRFLNISQENIQYWSVQEYIKGIEEGLPPIEIVPMRINNDVFGGEYSERIFLNTFAVYGKREYLHKLRMRYLEE